MKKIRFLYIFSYNSNSQVRQKCTKIFKTKNKIKIHSQFQGKIFINFSGNGNSSNKVNSIENRFFCLCMGAAFRLYTIHKAHYMFSLYLRTRNVYVCTLSRDLELSAGCECNLFVFSVWSYAIAYWRDNIMMRILIISWRDAIIS